MVFILLHCKIKVKSSVCFNTWNGSQQQTKQKKQEPNKHPKKYLSKHRCSCCCFCYLCFRVFCCLCLSFCKVGEVSFCWPLLFSFLLRCAYFRVGFFGVAPAWVVCLGGKEMTIVVELRWWKMTSTSLCLEWSSLIRFPEHHPPKFHKRYLLPS